MTATIRTGRVDDIAQVLDLWAADDVEPTITDDVESAENRLRTSARLVSGLLS